MAGSDGDDRGGGERDAESDVDLAAWGKGACTGNGVVLLSSGSHSMACTQKKV